MYLLSVIQMFGWYEKWKEWRARYVPYRTYRPFWVVSERKPIYKGINWTQFGVAEPGENWTVQSSPKDSKTLFFNPSLGKKAQLVCYYWLTLVCIVTTNLWEWFMHASSENSILLCVPTTSSTRTKMFHVFAVLWMLKSFSLHLKIIRLSTWIKFS